MTSSLQDTFNKLGLATTTSTSSSSSTSKTSGSSNTLSQSDFLALLTKQLTTQDPTNPTDSNAMIQQMAEFSTVTGINSLLTSFQDLSKSITSDQTIQASSLVGQYVYAPVSQAVLTSGGNVDGYFTLSSAATDSTLTITNHSTGATVKQIDLGSQAAGQVAFNWDGLDSSGAAAPTGIYDVKVTAMVGGKNTAQTTNIRSQVNSVTVGTGSSGLQLNLVGLGSSVPFSSISTIQ
ncbi:flagellar hook capping FlgD N-terminal domain-containing protein [Methylomonas sp. AM2-LC]|uniref:flagellar hook assembly protein FlgD n=1 Tax=Methylomonas sp. AM2-LC TaxID=3153301 RepID=UPI003264D180